MQYFATLIRCLYLAYCLVLLPVVTVSTCHLTEQMETTRFQHTVRHTAKRSSTIRESQVKGKREALHCLQKLNTES